MDGLLSAASKWNVCYGANERIASVYPEQTDDACMDACSYMRAGRRSAYLRYPSDDGV